MPVTIVEISCVEVWRELSELIEGTLDPELRRRLEHHLSLCAHCKAVLDGTANTIGLIADDRVFELPPDFGGRLFARLASELCDN